MTTYIVKKQSGSAITDDAVIEKVTFTCPKDIEDMMDYLHDALHDCHVIEVRSAPGE